MSEPIVLDSLLSDDRSGVLTHHSADVDKLQGLFSFEVLNRIQQESNIEQQCTCSTDWINDEWCDTDCFNEACHYDGFDCDGWCSPDCRSSWLGDGYCDIDCYTEACEFDKNDCEGYFPESFSLPLSDHSDFDYSNCQKTCDRTLLANSECDDTCNTAECNFDGKDCVHMCSSLCPASWLGDGECDYGCLNEKCHFDKKDCELCNQDCQSGMIGNGVCDIPCNVESCHYDMGDCYGVCWSSKYIDYAKEYFFYPHCRDEWKGDGFCDCYCVNSECDYDFGDCDEKNCTAELERLKLYYTKYNDTDLFNKIFAH